MHLERINSFGCLRFTTCSYEGKEVIPTLRLVSTPNWCVDQSAASGYFCALWLLRTFEPLTLPHPSTMTPSASDEASSHRARKFGAARFLIQQPTYQVLCQTSDSVPRSPPQALFNPRQILPIKLQISDSPPLDPTQRVVATHSERRVSSTPSGDGIGPVGLSSAELKVRQPPFIF